MDFHARFWPRLQALKERQPRTFPADALPDRFNYSAVLVPLYPGPRGSIEVIFTQRPQHLPSHPGQVSFPGGKREADDPTLADTALRETSEELGIAPETVQIMGRLDDAWSVAGHHVTPYVGWLPQRPLMTPAVGEVEQILIGDMQELMQPETYCRHRATFGGRTTLTHAFNWSGGYVWGLTADVLLELILWLRDEPCDNFDRRLRRLIALGNVNGPNRP